MSGESRVESRGSRVGPDLASARKRLESIEGREYWRSIEELLETEDFREHLHREFRVPIDSGVNRRELLSLMGASIALAGLTGCTRQPTERIYPYVKAPEEIVPGEAISYATAHLHGGYARGILVKSYEGRPVKIEGNDLHPASLGGTDVFAQGFILNMYDPDRSQALTERGQIRPWSALYAAVRLALEKERPSRGAGLRILTGTVTSPDARRPDRRRPGGVPGGEVGRVGARRPRERLRGNAPRLRRGRGADLRLRPGGRHPLARERLPGQRTHRCRATCTTSCRAAGPTR